MHELKSYVHTASQGCNESSFLTSVSFCLSTSLYDFSCCNDSNMTENLVTFDECVHIIGKLVNHESCAELKIIDFYVKNYCDGYPGFLGDYFSLNIRFCYVRKKLEFNLYCLTQFSNNSQTKILFKSLRTLIFYFFQKTRDIQEKSFFVKSLPIKNIEKRNILKDSGIFKKESKIFEILVPKLLKYSGRFLFHFMTLFSREQTLKYCEKI